MKRLTETQKAVIRRLRSGGLGYKAIADRLSISRETVRSCCNRSPSCADSIENPPDCIDVCKNCGKPVFQVPGTRRRLFCSGSCRQAWWNAHPEAVNRKAVYPFNCAHCGQSFTAYGNKKRKYCSHACYIAARFGEAAAS